MGRDCYNVNSSMGSVLRDMRSEKRCLAYAANRERIQRDREIRRARHIHIIESGIKLVLDRGELNLRWLDHYADNYERYPEVRKYAADILHVAHTDGRFSLARARSIEHLNNVIRKFKDHK